MSADALGSVSLLTSGKNYTPYNKYHRDGSHLQCLTIKKEELCGDQRDVWGCEQKWKLLF